MRSCWHLTAAFVVIGSVAPGGATLRAAPIGPLDPDLPAGAAEGNVAAVQPSQFREALAAFRQGDVPGTLRCLEEARAAHPELAPAEIMLANMFFSDNQADRGRAALEEAATKHPTDPEPHLIFGDLAFRQRRFSDAHVQYERGQQLVQTYDGASQRKRQLEIRALSGLAGVAEARRQFEDAEARLTELLRLEPQHAQAHFRLGNVLFAMGRPDEALRELRTAAELLDSAPSPSLTLAELYRQAGKLEEAERWIARAAQDSPQDARPQLAMARWQLEKRNDPEAALAFVERAAGLSANGFEASLLRGLVAWSQGKLDQAEEIFESLALKQPGNPQVNNYLAAVLAEQDEADRRRAWELVQLTASLGFQSADTSATLGWVAYHLGELAQAEQQLQKAVAGAGASRDAKYYLARTLFRRGQVAEAQRLLHEALAAEGLFVHIREAQQWQRGIGEPSN